MHSSANVPALGVTTSRRAFLALGAGALAATAVGPMASAAPIPGKHDVPRVRTCTFEHPYAPDSLWNCRPINPVLGTYQIPDTPTGWWATTGNGAYSIEVKKATAADGPVTIYPMIYDGKLEPGVWEPSEMTLHPTYTLPHFPSDTMPPSGTDGSVAIYDSVTGIIYSFWQLRHIDGIWRAKQVAVETICGQGWGDPAHFFKGASAAGDSQLAGLIREEEYLRKDEPMYYHALCGSMDNTGLKAGTDLGWGWTVDYIFPATSGDGWGNKPTGEIPEGALLMLPKDYDVESLPSRELRKVARTLQVYGVYIVDRNWGVPLTIGAANGYQYDLGDKPYNDPNLDDWGDWDQWAKSGVPQAMDDIRKHVRMVVDNDGYITANGKRIDPVPGWDVNLLSLRGGIQTPWTKVSGSGELGVFSAIDMRLHFTDGGVVQKRVGDTTQTVKWAGLKAGERVELRVRSTNKATLRLQFVSGDTVVYDSGVLKNGQKVRFTWRTDADLVLIADSGRGDSWIEVDLQRI